MPPMRADLDAVSRDPTGTTDARLYWADAAATRIAQLPAIPQYPRNIGQDLRLIQERAASLAADLAAFTVLRRSEERALRAAMSAVHKRNKKHEAAIRKALLHARRLHNSLIPISRLPHEILEDIFEHLFDLVAATHVCSAWRRVALGYPALWTDISFPLPSRKWASAMYGRSKSSPANVFVRVNGGTPDWTSTLVRNNLPRTKTLWIDRWLTDACSDIETPHSPCPMLEEIKTDLACPQFPNMIPAGYTPALRVLDVQTEEAFGWDAPCLTTLTSLTVVQLRNWSHPELPEVVKALRNMPCLENFSLVLENGFRYGGGGQGAIDPVQLPCLSDLYLEAPALGLSRFLEKIRIPTTASIHIVFVNSPKYKVKPDAIAESICALHNLDANAEPITKLVFSSTVPWSKSLRFLSSGLIMSAWRGTCRSYTSPIQIQIRLKNDYWRPAERPTLPMFKAFASNALRELVMMDEEWTEDTWKTAFSCTPLLERIEAVGKACGTLCAALRSPDVAPTLNALKLRDVGFRSPVDGLSTSDTDANDGADILLEDVLPGWLSERADAGHPLERLDLRSSGIVSTEHLAQLKAMLPNLLIINACADPGGPISFHWRSSFKHKGASAPFSGSSCDTLLVCAHAPDPSDDSDSESAVLVPDELGVDSEADSESEVIVLDELEVDDVDSVPHASEMLKTWDSYSYGERHLVF
ncbi:hypothetical protein FA95DRAFT_1559897 [Auriscalpium vulgare]|uniref:Uncharacterized protein n=1 Tax=Auriscalpium vulgare TaxID=40419 RepID=A0ACB8RSE8_9AGAM|nr:hypothetical protein FA95DRAFT_1559897 [Auriscalpium vulgare]